MILGYFGLRQLSALCIFLFFAIILLSLLFFGSVNPTPFAVIAAMMLSLSIVSAIVFGEPRRARGPFRAALVILFVLTAWAAVQTLGAPFAGANPVWHEVAGLVRLRGTSISVAPADTFAGILRIAVPIATFLIALMVGNSDERAKMMLLTLGGIGGLIALFGLVQFTLSPTTLIVVEKQYYKDSLTTVFVNHNTAATFLGLVILILITLAWETAQRVDVRHALIKIQDWRSPHRGGTGRLLIYLFLLVVAGTALMLTRSRAGIGCTTLALLYLVPFLATNWTKRASTGFQAQRTGWLHRLHPGIVSAIGILVVVAAFSGQVLLTAEIKGTDDPRFCVLPGILDALSHNALFGSGFATFQWVFPAFRDPACGIWGIWDRAHNVYLEGFLTLGIVFPVVLLVAAVFIVRALRIGMKERRRLKHYSALGIAGVILVGLHSAIDFSLQIPGFAVYFAAFLGAIVSISLGRREIGAATGD